MYVYARIVACICMYMCEREKHMHTTQANTHRTLVRIAAKQARVNGMKIVGGVETSTNFWKVPTRAEKKVSTKARCVPPHRHIPGGHARVERAVVHSTLFSGEARRELTSQTNQHLITPNQPRRIMTTLSSFVNPSIYRGDMETPKIVHGTHPCIRVTDPL